MKELVESMGDALGAFHKAKEENFGGVPEDYREMIEELLKHPAPCTMAIIKMGEAAKEFGKFVNYLRESGMSNESILSKTDTEEVHALTVNSGDLDIPTMIRKNWGLFEPAFLYFYLGIKVGEQREREQREALASIARAERQKTNPNAFDTIKPDTSQVMLPAVSDTSELPAISSEKAEAFRKELEAELKAERDKRRESDKAA